MASRIETVNIKAGLPTAEEAKQRLEAELQRARSAGAAVLKLVHGYGSTGKGGRLRTSLRAELDALHAAGRIGSIVTGESFSIFDAASRGLLDRYPDLRRDSDLERGNPGVTLVELSGRRRNSHGP